MIRRCDAMEAAPWCGERGLPFDEDAFGETYMVDECLVIGVFRCGKVAHLDSMITKPGTGPKRVAAALEAIYRDLLGQLRDEGVKYVSWAAGTSAAAVTMTRFGTTGKPVVYFTRRLT